MRFEWLAYRRPLRTAAVSARGTLAHREGLLIRLINDAGAIGYGEVAPWPQFGSETIEEAIDWAQRLGNEPPQRLAGIVRRHLGAIANQLPCCAFGLSSALSMLDQPAIDYRFQNCALLPSGDQLMPAFARHAAAGFTVFKLKLGIGWDPATEIAAVRQLCAEMRADMRLRLDANGSLRSDQLSQWLGALRDLPVIDFLEQPLPRGAEAEMTAAMRRHGVAIALDESVVAPGDAQRFLVDAPWPGPVVLKLSLLGDPARTLAAASQFAKPLVASSVFETGIGVHACLRAARQLGLSAPVGFGTIDSFADPLGLFAMSPQLDSRAIAHDQLEFVWQTARTHYARQ